MRAQTWTTWWTASLTGLITSVLLWVITSTGLAQREEIVERGKLEFQTYCTVCHGSGATGDGPLAEELKTKPPNLNQISKNNEGKFPFWRTYQIIKGADSSLRGHGREMPVWGDRFQWEGRGRGVDAVVARVRGRIFSLVYYLESIQGE